MRNETVQAIESNIKKAKELIELGNALQRLRLNKDFKSVVLTGYFEQEAIRLVHLKADSNMQSEDMQRAILTQMDAIGSLSQYFNAVLHKAGMASKSLETDEEVLAEIAAEELNNG